MNESDAQPICPLSDPEQHRIRNLCRLRQLDYHTTIGSTNDRGLQLAASESFRSPVLVLADVQSAGRGRGGHAWWAQPGALLFTLVINADECGFRAGDTSCASLTVGLAICQVVARRWPGLAVGMKWPNDVLIGDLKVSGILVEANAARPSRLVIGCGLNVNNSMTTAPPELQISATALCDEVQQSIDRVDLLIDVVTGIQATLAVMGPAPETMVEAWDRFNVMTDRQVTIEAGNRRRQGICRGIEPGGGLMLESEGQVQVVVSGSVVDLFPVQTGD